MDKIEKIRAEIERRYAYQKEMYSKTKPDGRPNDGWAESLAIMGELEELRDFIDTLEEEPDKDLDDEISRTYHDGSVADTSDLDHTSYENIARHFAEWQKEQMLKEAVEGKVYFQMGGIKRVKSDDFENPNIHLGDKVKLIIIKED